MTKQTVKVATPMGVNKPDLVKTEEIPLPPQAMWQELDNSGSAAPAEAAKAEPPKPRQREALDFDGSAHFRVIPLAHPFKLDGKRVSEIRVRRLTIGEVGELIDRFPGSYDLFDIYAEMTGFAPPVLRGLIDEDGEQVTGACYDFLPRLFRPREAEPPAT